MFCLKLSGIFLNPQDTSNEQNVTSCLAIQWGILHHFLAFWLLAFEMHPASSENCIYHVERARMTKTAQTKSEKKKRSLHKFLSVPVKGRRLKGRHKGGKQVHFSRFVRPFCCSAPSLNLCYPVLELWKRAKAGSECWRVYVSNLANSKWRCQYYKFKVYIESSVNLCVLVAYCHEEK